MAPQSTPKPAACDSKIKVTLLVDEKSEKVLFAKASKQFVDFLFSLMSLPLGSIVKLLNPRHGMVGCVGDLYDSVKSLTETDYVQSTKNLESILNPKAPHLAFEDPLLCSMFTYIQDFGERAHQRSPLVDASAVDGCGFEKLGVTYKVLDNLQVQPMPTTVQDLSPTKELVVDVGADEGLKILQASLKSKNVLTDVFLSNARG